MGSAHHLNRSVAGGNGVAGRNGVSGTGGWVKTGGITGRIDIPRTSSGVITGRVTGRGTGGVGNAGGGGIVVMRSVVVLGAAKISLCNLPRRSRRRRTHNAGANTSTNRRSHDAGANISTNRSADNVSVDDGADRGSNDARLEWNSQCWIRSDGATARDRNGDSGAGGEII